MTSVHACVQAIAARRGEAAIRPAAEFANAIFDAAGTRLRRAPFTADRLEASFAGD